MLTRRHVCRNEAIFHIIYSIQLLLLISCTMCSLTFMAFRFAAAVTKALNDPKIEAAKQLGNRPIIVLVRGDDKCFLKLGSAGRRLHARGRYNYLGPVANSALMTAAAKRLMMLGASELPRQQINTNWRQRRDGQL